VIPDRLSETKLNKSNYSSETQPGRVTFTGDAENSELGLTPGTQRRQLDAQIQARGALMSPKSSHPQYNRLKYYSALKTGYDHLIEKVTDANGQEVPRDPGFLLAPSHVFEKNLFMIPLTDGKRPKTSFKHCFRSG